MFPSVKTKMKIWLIPMNVLTICTSFSGTSQRIHVYFSKMFHSHSPQWQIKAADCFCCFQWSEMCFPVILSVTPQTSTYECIQTHSFVTGVHMWDMQVSLPGQPPSVITSYERPRYDFPRLLRSGCRTLFHGTFLIMFLFNASPIQLLHPEG